MIKKARGTVNVSGWLAASTLGHRLNDNGAAAGPCPAFGIPSQPGQPWSGAEPGTTSYDGTHARRLGRYFCSFVTGTSRGRGNLFMGDYFMVGGTSS